MKNQSDGNVEHRGDGLDRDTAAPGPPAARARDAETRKTSAARNPTFIPDIASRCVNPERRNISCIPAGIPARSPVVRELRICPACARVRLPEGIRRGTPAQHHGTRAAPGIVPFAPDPGRRGHDQARRAALAAWRDRSREPAEIAVAAYQTHLPAQPRPDRRRRTPRTPPGDEDLERQIQADGGLVAAQADILEVQERLAVPDLGWARDASAGQRRPLLRGVRGRRTAGPDRPGCEQMPTTAKAASPTLLPAASHPTATSAAQTASSAAAAQPQATGSCGSHAPSSHAADDRRTTTARTGRAVSGAATRSRAGQTTAPRARGTTRGRRPSRHSCPLARRALRR